MINASINISSISRLAENLRSLNTDSLLQGCATIAYDSISQRVFQQGRNSDDERIGTYSPGYMKLRTGNYGNTPVLSRGSDKGKPKQKKTKKGDAGVYTKGKNKGKPRIRYNRNTDTKVILSLTREMENDIKVLKLDDGYGIGFSNSHNFDKAMWNNTRYGQPVWKLTKKEEEQVKEYINGRVYGAIYN